MRLFRMTPVGNRDIHFIVPGSINEITGGTIYDRRIIEGITGSFKSIQVHELSGNFPFPGDTDRRMASTEFQAIPDGRRVIVDGLVLGAIPEIAMDNDGPLDMIGLIHHPLCDETGLSDRQRETLYRSETKALKSVRMILVTSGFTAERLRDIKLVDEDVPVKVVEPGVDPAPAGSEHMPGDSFSLISVGALTERKSQTDLLFALSKLKDLDWRWTCVGRTDHNGDYARTALDMADRMGLSNRVTFTGEIGDEELGRVFREAHLLVHTARYEGFGMVIQEAMAHGIPVLSSSGGALKYTMPDGAGILFEPGDTVSLSENLRDIMENQKLYASLRKGALKARENIRTWDDATAEFLKAIR